MNLQAKTMLDGQFIELFVAMEKIWGERRNFPHEKGDVPAIPLFERHTYPA